MADPLPACANPYVGPRTFTRADRDRFFGREREARELLSLVISQRLVLFYAQSGAGKSSLINTRLAPDLEDAGFAVLPVARVGGELPPGLAAVKNVFLFNLMTSFDASGRAPGRLAHLDLADFLARLSSDDGQTYTYDEALAAQPEGAAVASPAPALPAAGDPYAEPNYVLIIDQFEEIFTAHPGRWQERTAFFQQLDAALRADRRLWVVLSLREDYVAALDPYAPLLTDKLRARFYMERMGVEAGRDAICKPAAGCGRAFAEGVAEKLADDLCQVRVPGQEGTVAGQYVEPVQLQVVCYQLWENLGQGTQGTEGTEGTQITFDDLAEAGDVNRALTQFYEETLAAALADPAAAGVSERRLRAWLDGELITEAGTRGLVHQGETETGGLPNGVVRALQRRFLVRSEARGGDTWVELVHDRLVEPIRASNAAWFPEHLSALQRQAALWAEQGRSPGLLLRDAALAEAEKWAAGHAKELQPGEQAFLAACRQAQDVVERERRQSRRIRILGIVAGVVAALAIAASIWAWNSSRLAETNAQKAKDAQVVAEANAAEADRQKQRAEANAKLAQDQLDRQAGLTLLQEAYASKGKGDVQGAIEKLRAARATKTDLGIDVETEIADVRRQAATQLAQQGEALAKSRDFPAAAAKFQAALALVPPPDTPVYVYVPAGAFVMGSDVLSEERPIHTVTLDAFWIQRTEVTNAQYGRCVEAKGCEPPADGNIRYRDLQFAKQPVAGVTWYQAQTYAAWVGGRLPTEAEWEKACRGTDGRTYPWGNRNPTRDLLNYDETGLGTWSAVGSYPGGASPYGALDMAGNVYEWTADWYGNTYYADSPWENPTGPAKGTMRVLRGGSFGVGARSVRCACRGWFDPDDRNDHVGFRVVSPGF